MRTIFKYPLLTKHSQTLEIHGLIQVLCVEVQQGTPCLWCLVEACSPMAKYTVITHGTGHNADDTVDAQYVGSYMLFDGNFVGHVFIK